MGDERTISQAGKKEKINRQMDRARYRNQILQKRLLVSLDGLEQQWQNVRCQIVIDKKLALKDLKDMLEHKQTFKRGIITPKGLSDRDKELMFVIKQGKSVHSISLEQFDERFGGYMEKMKSATPRKDFTNKNMRDNLLTSSSLDMKEKKVVLPMLSSKSMILQPSVDMYTYDHTIPDYVAKSPVVGKKINGVLNLYKPVPSMRNLHNSEFSRKPQLQLVSQRCLMRRVRTAII